MTLSATTTTLVSRPRTRRAAPRVKTGCITCKVRRVKCGEEKPHCLRCTSTGRKCDGYAFVSSNSGQTTVFPLTDLVKMQRGPRIQVSGAKDLHYLEFYHQWTASSISTDSFDQDFWSKSCLQISHSEASVRHALIALGYLNRSETGTLKNARTMLKASSGQETFLIHYNKAIKSLTERISEASYSPEIGLVSCLIFVCIEILRGNYDTAMLHYNNGLRIIKTLVEPQSSRSGICSQSGLIEKSLVPMFRRLLLTGILYGVPSELAMALVQKEVTIAQFSFKSIVDAQSTMFDLRNQSMLFIRHMGENGRPTVPNATKLLDQVATLKALDAWWEALVELERTTTLSKEDTLIAHSLKACYYSCYILAASITDPNQCAIDRHLSRFQALVYHCRQVINSTERTSTSTPAANFTFEITVIPPLNFTASRCRCPATRREAVALLERNIPREGLWDAQQQAIVLHRLIEIEERELDPVTGWPTENARVLSTIVRGDMDGDGGFYVYFAMDIWGEGRGEAPLPPEGARGRMWKEWFKI